MYYIEVTEENIENLKKEGKMRMSILIFVYTIQFDYLKVYTKFENTGSNWSREICARNFHWRERKMNKKGTDKQYATVFCYTIQLITIKFCTKF